MVHDCSRREFLSHLSLGVAALATVPLGAAEGKKIAEAFDRAVEGFMEARHVPGGALAVVRDRRLVYARGYGWADREKEIPVRPDSLFRIASVSKPFTAVAVLKLVEEKKLALETPVFDIVKLDPLVEPDTKPDPRLKKVTLRQVLQHTGGWDRDKSFDPMFRSRDIARVTGVESPPGPREIIRYMLGQPLDFDPGQRYAYSNFGYCVLGRVIEQISGQPYETFVREKILAPMNIRRMRLGASLPDKRAEGEVHYYTATKSTARTVFGDPSRKVSWPDGGFCLEAMDAHGGWIASAVDLARFAAALDDPRRCPVLGRPSIHEMYEPPAAPAWRTRGGSLEEAYYGCGWMVRPIGKAGSANYWHNGSLPGTFSLLVRRWDGLSWAMLFNQRSEDIKLPDAAIDSALHRAADAVSEWPKEDLFARWLPTA